MKKLIKTMAAVTAAVLALSFVACSYDGANLGADGKDGPDRDNVAEYDKNLGGGSSDEKGGEDDDEDDDDDDDDDDDSNK